VSVDARQQLDFPLSLFQQVVTVAEVLDPLLIPGESFRQPQVAIFQIVDDRFQAGQGRFEGGGLGG
jgi:hypothetical protein